MGFSGAAANIGKKVVGGLVSAGQSSGSSSQGGSDTDSSKSKTPILDRLTALLNKRNDASAKAAVANNTMMPPSYKKGGLIKKTGLAKVHKGERVLTKAQQKKRGPRKST